MTLREFGRWLKRVLTKQKVFITYEMDPRSDRFHENLVYCESSEA